MALRTEIFNCYVFLIYKILERLVFHFLFGFMLVVFSYLFFDIPNYLMKIFNQTFLDALLITKTIFYV